MTSKIYKQINKQYFLHFVYADITPFSPNVMCIYVKGGLHKVYLLTCEILRRTDIQTTCKHNSHNIRDH